MSSSDPFFLPNARPLLNNKPVRPNAIPIRISGITVLNDNFVNLFTNKFNELNDCYKDEKY